MYQLNWYWTLYGIPIDTLFSSKGDLVFCATLTKISDSFLHAKETLESNLCGECHKNITDFICDEFLYFELITIQFSYESLKICFDLVPVNPSCSILLFIGKTCIITGKWSLSKILLSVTMFNCKITNKVSSMACYKSSKLDLKMVAL